MDIKQVDIDSLKPAEYNPRELDADQEKALKESLSKFGIVDPIIVNNHPERVNVIIGGHQRAKVWRSLGNTTIPVFYVTLDKEQERELNIRLNKNTGSFSWALLEEFFKKDELLTWGFTENDLHLRFKNETKGDDDAPELPAVAQSKLGDIYQLGPHILMCGDSTKASDVSKLMAGKLADLIWTDPPYNVNYTGAGKKTTRTIENDNMEQEAFRAFLASAFQRASESMKPTASMYCCYASRTHREFEDSINKAGFEVRNQIIWVKTVASMGWGDYRWKHEPILYCKKPGTKTDFFAGRKEWTVWDHEPTDQEKIDIVNKMIKAEEDGQSTVWRCSREFNYVHPCLPAGEKVFVNGAWIAIEEVKAGQASCYGEIKETSTFEAEEIVEIKLTDGCKVKATGNHPFLVERGGDVYWIEARLIRKSDFVLTNADRHSTLKPCKQAKSHQRDTEEYTTERRGGDGSSTSSFGKKLMGLFQKAIKSITKTKTSWIMTLETLRLSVPLTTRGYTLVALKEMMEHGSSHAKGVENTNQSQKNTGITQEDGQQENSAENASLSTASKYVRLYRRAVGSVRTIPGKTKVFNLTIEGIPAFDTVIGVSHNTQKQVALVIRALMNSCKTHGIVLDLFGESGSTLIAAEKSSRQARIMEYAPEFVDCIVQRYVEFCIENDIKWSVLRNNENISGDYAENA
jgi:DNA modification methylase